MLPSLVQLDALGGQPDPVDGLLRTARMPAAVTFVVLLLIGGCTGAGGRAVSTPGSERDARADLDAPEGSDGRADATGTASCLHVRDARSPGGAPFEATLRDGRIEAPGGAPCDEVLDAGGLFAVPAFVDSHVHLAYLPVGDELSRGGVAAAVDLAAPLASLSEPAGALRVVHAGPMITPPGGYPTRSWGADGYGIECADAAACAVAVDRVADAGAAIVKVPIGAEPDHDQDTLRAIVARAHARGLLVAVHALDDASARRTAEAGADLLAHTPVEPLSDETVRAWSGRAVISTLRAFGGSASSVDNLRRLHAAGATVLYGTDLGNTRTPGIDAAELELLARAGLSPEEILIAATAAPARIFALDDLGSLTPGHAASLLLLTTDPLEDITSPSRPSRVILKGIAYR